MKKEQKKTMKEGRRRKEEGSWEMKRCEIEWVESFFDV